VPKNQADRIKKLGVALSVQKKTTKKHKLKKNPVQVNTVDSFASLTPLPKDN